jgi:hypothetical protein
MAEARYSLAAIQCRAALGLSMDLRDMGGIIEALEGIAAVAGARDEAECAVRFYAAADTLRRGIRFVIPPSAASAREPVLDKSKAALGDERFKQIWQASVDLSLHAVNDVAREALGGPPPLIAQVIRMSFDEGASERAEP